MSISNKQYKNSLKNLKTECFRMSFNIRSIYTCTYVCEKCVAMMESSELSEI